MKKIKFFSIFLICILVLQFSFVYAAKNKTIINSVEIKDIDYPYSTGSVLDTSANVSDKSYSIVSEVSWSSSNGKHMVNIILRPFINYEYSTVTTATVNGNVANSVLVNDDGYLEVSYMFEKDNSVSIPNSSNTLKHVISVYSSKNGNIIPNEIRAPHNKNFTVQIIPNEGYEVSDVIVDGDSVGPVTEYTFIKVTKTHKIRAYFKKIDGYETPSTSTDNDEINKEDIGNNKILYNIMIELFKAIF